jgi:hypothetical protein
MHVYTPLARTNLPGERVNEVRRRSHALLLQLLETLGVGKPATGIVLGCVATTAGSSGSA